MIQSWVAPGRPRFLLTLARCAALAFLLFWIHVMGLGMIFGEHLTGLGHFIGERADFLLAHGIAPHPLTESLRDLPFWTRYRSGALLAFLFFALPLALGGALVETLAATLSKALWRWSARLVGLILLLVFLGEPLFTYSESYTWWPFSLVLLFLAPPLIHESLQHLEAGWKPPLRRLWFLSPLVVGLALPSLVHPVWDFFLSPERYPGIQTTTLARDALLLNDKGRSFFNNWYYGHTIYPSEIDRVTQFQPMTVALVDLPRDPWTERFNWHFASPKYPTGFRIAFVEMKDLDEVKLALERDLIDFAALGPSALNTFDTTRHDPGSFGFFQIQPWDSPGDHLHDLKSIFSQREKRDRRTFTLHPVFLRQEHLRNIEGYREDLHQSYLRYRDDLLKDLLGSPRKTGSLALFVALGWIYLFVLLGGRLLMIAPRFCLSVGCLSIALNTSFFLDSWDFWSAPQPEARDNVWQRLYEGHRAAKRFSAEDVAQALARKDESDLRLQILRISTLGRGHSRSGPDTQAEISKALQPWVDTYHQHPFNLRYKILDACANIPSLREQLIEACKDEEHPYVRWYSVFRGFEPQWMPSLPRPPTPSP